MSLYAKRNKDGCYKLFSSTKMESLHEGWLTEDEAKALLIARAQWKFMQEIIDVELSFPDAYSINGRNPKDSSPKTDKWMLENAYAKDGFARLTTKCASIIQRTKPKLIWLLKRKNQKRSIK